MNRPDVEPETGATWLDYDAAGNVAWSAEGSTLTALSCVRTTVPAGEKILRTYDPRNRLTLVDYPTGTNAISTSYYADGAVQSVTTGQVTTEYTYNKRRMLTSERTLFGSLDWLTQYGYTALGDPATLTYRDGHQVSFAPNALGQATQAGTYATGASYFPNGALKQFTFGNGLVHTLTQNARQLPEQSRTALGANVVLDDSYDFDFNGNVAGITDALPGAPGNRTMSYDALDRLTGVTAGVHQGGNATFAYDPLDNLRIADQGARQYRYHYHASTGRLDEIKTPGGSLLLSFGYDVRGNQTSKNLTDTFTFDRANRLLSASTGTSTYIYDGLGRRVREISGGASTYFQYGQAGQLLYTQDHKTSQRHNHIHFAGSLVAKRSIPIGGGAATITYLHTDALGSPVAETNSAAVVTRRERMTAYGEPADGTYENGPGFTGHQTDAATKLVYMQQRYYDPAIGRFLSVDPMASDMQSGWNFNRYNYAANNPYKFKDPDGRAIRRQGDGLPDQWTQECRSDPRCRFALNTGNANQARRKKQAPAVKDGEGRTKPEGDFILYKGEWIHRTALNAHVLNHRSMQQSHVATAIGASVTGFVAVKGKSTTATLGRDSSGATCGILQTCDMTGVGGYFGTGGALQASVTPGAAVSGTTTTGGVFVVFGAVRGFGGSIDSGDEGLSGSAGYKGWGIGLAVGYQQCEINTSCL